MACRAGLQEEGVLVWYEITVPIKLKLKGVHFTAKNFMVTLTIEYDYLSCTLALSELK